MAEVHKLPDTDKAVDQASEWIARLNADDVADDDRARFEEWRKAHPLHARTYEEMATTWQKFTHAAPVVRAVSFGQSMNEAMNEATSMDSSRWRRSVGAIAAAMLLGIIGWWYAGQHAPETMFQTAIGEHAVIALPDGSTLELNTNSLARVNYSEHARIVRLERGEAFFEVAHDKQRPFWVVAGGSWVRAVGTAFNVYVRPNGLRVTVNEGTIKVASATSLVRQQPSDNALEEVPVSVLTVGQQADLHGTVKEIRSLPPDELTRSVGWRGGTLYFENETLGEIVDEIGRYTELELIVKDADLRSLPIGGTFQANARGAEALLKMLQDGLGIRTRRENGRVYIESGSMTLPHRTPDVSGAGSSSPITPTTRG